MPEQIIPCGPIIMPALPIREVDFEFDEWLSGGPTIYVDLGTLVELTPHEASEMAKAIRRTRELADSGALGPKNSQPQVFWKPQMP